MFGSLPVQIHVLCHLQMRESLLTKRANRENVDVKSLDSVISALKM